MSTFSYKNELKKMIDSQQLVEINFRDEDERSVAYLLAADDNYMVFARVTNDATLGGVTICLTSDFESIQTETRFAQTLSKKITDNSLYEEAMEYANSIKKMTFPGFVSAFKNSQTLVDIRTVTGDSFTGKIIDFDKNIILLDECYIEENKRFSLTYLNPSLIQSITVGSRWLKLVSLSQSQ